jgi:hypothetical protein
VTIQTAKLKSHPWPTWLLAAALAILAALLLLKVADSARLMGGLFLWPQQLDESESMIVAETLLLDGGTNIWARPTPQLFISAPYPPLYYLLNWPILHFVGVSFKVGRALSLLCTLAAGALICALVVQVTRDRIAGGLAALAWWGLGLVAFWGALVKPDMLAVACGLAGLWWLLARPPAQVWVALPFFWGAIYSKQTALAAAGAACAWLLLTRPRTGAAFTGILLAGALLPALALNALTDGGYYYHIVTVHDLPWYADRFAQFSAGFLAAYWPWVVVGMGGILGLLLLDGQAWWAAWRKGPSPAPTTAPTRYPGLLLGGYLALSLGAAIGAGTLGGNHNHFLDWAAAGCLGFGLAIYGLRALPGQAGRVAAAAVVLVLAAQVPGMFRPPAWMGLELRVPPASVAEGWSNVTQYVTNDPGAAYSDNVGLLLNARKRLWTTDPFTQTHATFYHRWDESALVAAIQAQVFSLIILRVDLTQPDEGQGDVSPGIAAAVRAAYTLDQRNVEFIYKPKK